MINLLAEELSNLSKFRDIAQNVEFHHIRKQKTIGNPMGDIPANEQGQATVETFHMVRPYFEGDYYPLFEHTTEETVWWGYQLDLPEEGRGMVLVFRREQSPYAKNSMFLHAIDKNAEYDVTDKDAGTTTRMSGLGLACIIVEIPQAPGSRMLFYRKQM